MPGGHVDRGVLSSNYQQPGDIYSDSKTEGAFETIAQQVDTNWDDYNTLKTNLASTAPGASGAHNVESAPIASVNGANVWAQLSDLMSKIQSIQNGTIPNGTITPDMLQNNSIQLNKLAPDVANAINASTPDIAHLQVVQANLVALAEINAQSVPNSGYGYDLFRGSSVNLYSAAGIDLFQSNSVGALAVGATTASLKSVNGLGVGKEVTFQDVVSEPKRERVVITNIAGNVITFTPALTNAYADQASVYRSLVRVDTTLRTMGFAKATYGSLESLTKLVDPAPLPAGQANGVAYSADGVYMALALNVSPFVAIYKVNGSNFTKLTDPLTLPAGAANDVTFSNDGNYLVVGHAITPFITIYKRSGDTFTKLANPSTLPPNTVNKLSFSSDSAYLAISSGTTAPFQHIYKRTGDTFEKLPNLANAPSNTVTAVAFSQDTNYLVLGNNGTAPFLFIYKRSGDTFTKLADPATMPSSQITGASFSSDGTYLAIVTFSSPFVYIYKRNGDTFTKLTDPITLPPAYPKGGVVFSFDTNYLALALNVSPFVFIYKRNGDTFTKLADPSSLPAMGAANGIATTTDGALLTLAGTTTPFLTTYSAVIGIDVLQVDVRYNIAPPTGLMDELRSWIQYDDFGGFTVSSAISIVDSAANESFAAMTESISDYGSIKETYFNGFIASPEEKCTHRITMKRASTADNKVISKYLASVNS